MRVFWDVAWYVVPDVSTDGSSSTSFSAASIRTSFALERSSLPMKALRSFKTTATNVPTTEHNIYNTHVSHHNCNKVTTKKEMTGIWKYGDICCRPMVLCLCFSARTMATRRCYWNLESNHVNSWTLTLKLSNLHRLQPAGRFKWHKKHNGEVHADSTNGSVIKCQSIFSSLVKQIWQQGQRGQTGSRTNERKNNKWNKETESVKILWTDKVTRNTETRKGWNEKQISIRAVQSDWFFSICPAFIVSGKKAQVKERKKCEHNM